MLTYFEPQVDSSVEVMRGVYRRVFNTLQAQATGPSALGVIRQNFTCSIGNAFGMSGPRTLSGNATSVTYKFFAAPEDVATYSGLLCFIGGHETEHALRHYAWLHKEKNTTATREAAQAAYAATQQQIEKIESIRLNYRQRLKNNPDADKLIGQRFDLLLQNRDMIRQTYIDAAQEEEFGCDATGLIVDPAVDLNMLHDYLTVIYDMKKRQGQVSDVTNLARLDYAVTHPTPQARIAQLQRQRRLIV
jgi:hypothetical protein